MMIKSVSFVTVILKLSLFCGPLPILIALSSGHPGEP